MEALYRVWVLSTLVQDCVAICLSVEEVDLVRDQNLEAPRSVGSDAREQRRIPMSILQLDQILLLVWEHLTELEEHLTEHLIVIRDSVDQS